MRLNNKLRTLGLSLTAAIPVGFLYGILLRVNMRVVALAHPEMASGFHWTSTLMIIVVGMGMTMAGAVVYTPIRHWLPDRKWPRAAAYGIVSLLFFGVPFLLTNPGGELVGSQAALGLPLFALGFFLEGAAIVWFADKIEQWADVRQANRFRLIRAAGLILAIPALTMLGAFIYEIYTELPTEIRKWW